MSDADTRRAYTSAVDGVWTRLSAMAGDPSLLSATLGLDVAAGTVRLGRDADGLPHLLIPVDPLTAPHFPTSAGNVSLRVRDLVLDRGPVRFLDVACLRADLAGIFSGLIVDVCSRLADDPHDPVAIVTSLIEDWRALLEPGTSAWTQSRCAGLFAELTVLERLLTRDPESLRWWTGPAGAAQDFRSVHGAVEVKATLGSEGRVVRIHGSDQLDAAPTGSLHLAWFRLARGDDGSTTRELLTRVAEGVKDGKAWAAVLSPLKIPAEDHEAFDGCRFVLAEERWYVVNDHFPRIVPQVFSTGAVPGGVGGIEYLVDLDSVTGSLRVQDPDLMLAGLIGAS